MCIDCAEEPLPGAIVYAFVEGLGRVTRQWVPPYLVGLSKDEETLLINPDMKFKIIGVVVSVVRYL
ncbi:MAG: hypothetical protein ABIR47_10870 [Candidatus Kapaibacterium sp.]